MLLGGVRLDCWYPSGYIPSHKSLGRKEQVGKTGRNEEVG